MSFQINGVPLDPEHEVQFASVGDLDGDGLDDFLILSPNIDEAYLFFGNSLDDLDAADGVQDGIIDLSSIETLAGGEILAYEFSVREDTIYLVGSAGDVDGDGLDDLLIYVEDPWDGTNPDSPDTTYILFASELAAYDAANGQVDGTIDLLGLGPAIIDEVANAYVFLSGDLGDEYPFMGSVAYTASAGDVDGDGLDDFFVSLEGNSAGDSTYLVFGAHLAVMDAADGAVDGRITLVDSIFEVDGSFSAYRLDGVRFENDAGITASTVSDLDGDGGSEILIGATASLDESFYGGAAAYLLYSSGLEAIDGADGSEDGVLYLGSTNTETSSGFTGYVINTPGASVNDSFAYTITNISDIDGDGEDEILVGVPGDVRSSKGYLDDVSGAYVVFSSSLAELDGNDGTVDGSIQLEPENLASETGFGAYGFFTDALGQELSKDVASAGDVDGDGLGDFLLGGQGGDKAWLIFGAHFEAADQADGAVDGFVDLSGKPAQTSGGFIGYRFDASTNSGAGSSVASAGDVDGDGLSDVTIGTSSAQGSYLILASNLADLDAADGSVDGVIKLANVTTLTEPNIAPTIEDATFSMGYDAGETTFDISDFADDADPSETADTLVYEVISIEGEGIARFDGASLIYDPGTAFDDLPPGEDRFIHIDVSVTDAGGLKAYSRIVIQVEGAPTEGRLEAGYTIIQEYIGQADTRHIITVSAGDMNGDGKDDFLIGDSGYDLPETSQGAAFVVFSDALEVIDLADGLSDHIVDVGLANLNLGSEMTGYQFQGVEAGGLSGYVVSSAGDVDGDGLDDILIGSYLAGDTGRNQLVFSAHLAELDAVDGQIDGEIDLLNLSAVVVGGQFGGYEIVGAHKNDFSGYSVSSAGDINGDGLDDLMIGGLGNDRSENRAGGVVHILSGADLAAIDAADGVADGLIDLEFANIETADGFAGYEIVFGYTDGGLGYDVKSAGDVDGDGIGDLFITSGGKGGDSFLLLGGSLRDADAADGKTDGTIQLGTAKVSNGDLFGTYELLGQAVSPGDVDGDGKDDILIGNPYVEQNREPYGAAYLIFSASLGAVDAADYSLDGEIDLANVNTIVDGSFAGYIFWGVSAYSFTGGHVESAGDVDGDGLDDFLITATWSNANQTAFGGTYLIFGASLEVLDRADGEVDGQIYLENFNELTTTGFAGYLFDDVYGWSAEGIGDIDGDGLGDFFVSDDQTDQVYTILGGQLGIIDAMDGKIDGIINPQNTSISASYYFEGTSASETLEDGARATAIFAGDGDDHILAGLGDDVSIGGDGNDHIFDNFGANSLLGSSGDDLLVVFSGSNYLAGEADEDLLIGGIGQDLLEGGDGNDVLVGDVVAGFGVSDLLVGGAGDDMMEGGQGVDLFVFSPDEGSDIVGVLEINTADPSGGTTVVAVDFEPGVDLIVLDGFDAFRDASNAINRFENDENGNAVFSANGTTIIFYGVQADPFGTDPDSITQYDLIVL